MAEGWAKHLGLEAASAGTHPAAKVAPHSITVMSEIGIDISHQTPSLIDDFDVVNFDRIISMGCGVSCPTIRIDEDWELEDPVGESIDVYRATRDDIEIRVRALVG
tara:strand:+ start:496 stop:813 length:318 start_codon:yes stop_codon:yes gene_type:complete